ncbi:MAG: ABC transporter permease, partial [Pseudomonadota bacterium]
MISVASRIAWRELRGGLNNFWVYICCIALGVAAIAAAGSVTQVFTRGLDAQARTLLGGDAMLVASQRRMDSEERDFADTLGDVTEKITLNMMGAFEGDRRQVDVIAIDDAFPLIGEMGLTDIRGPPSTLLSEQAGAWGIAVSASFLEAFDAEIGDRVELGTVTAEIRARLDTLPDEIGTVGTFGPEALIDIAALDQAGRLATGQLFRARLIVAFDEERSFDAARQAFQSRFPDTTLELRAPEDSVDGLGTLLGLLNSFLSVVGIAALIAGGVGVEQATSSFLRARTGAIAALKSLGAESATIRAAYMLQLLSLSVFGAGIGVIIGATTPYLLVAIAGDA